MTLNAFRPYAFSSEEGHRVFLNFTSYYYTNKHSGPFSGKQQTACVKSLSRIYISFLRATRLIIPLSCRSIAGVNWSSNFS